MGYKNVVNISICILRHTKNEILFFRKLIYILSAIPQSNLGNSVLSLTGSHLEYTQSVQNVCPFLPSSQFRLPSFLIASWYILGAIMVALGSLASMWPSSSCETKHKSIWLLSMVMPRWWHLLFLSSNRTIRIKLSTVTFSNQSCSSLPSQWLLVSHLPTTR